MNYYYLQAPTIIGDFQLGVPIELRNKGATEAYNLKKESYRTNLQSQMSSYHVWNETKVYDTLLNDIQAKINQEYRKQQGIEESFKYHIDEAWTAIYKEDEYALSHKHDGFTISFCYYLKVGKSTTPLIFDQLLFNITPKDDMLLIFDSNLIHSVPPHKGEDRIVLAGNCILTA